MRHLLFAVFLVVACATVAAADSYTDAVSAVFRDDYARAARLFRPLVEQGHAGAQCFLGVLYANGQGVPQDYQVAGQWYRRAAEQGAAAAQFHLGVLYAHGQGLPQDFIRSYMWLTIAAEASRGDDVKTAIKNQNNVASQMTAAQIGKAQEMTRRCQQSQFKECD